MERVGELLVTHGVVTVEQIEQALHAQILWGGRIGTNLVDLGIVDLEVLARTLARQHRAPAALEPHFEAADPKLQQRLPREIAERYACVPLYFFSPDHVVVATTEPLDRQGRASVADALGIESAQLLCAIAAELRIRYHLECVYDIAREARFLRSRSAIGLPRFEHLGVPVSRAARGTQQDLVEQVARGARRERAMGTPTGVPTTQPIPLPLPQIPQPERRSASAGTERRRYVSTLRDRDPTGPRRLPSGSLQPLATPIGPTLGEATRAIRRSTDRETLAQLVMGTVERFLPSRSAVLLLLRGDVAIPCAGFRRDGAPPSSVAIPIDEPGLLPGVIENNVTTRAYSDELGSIDTLLLENLGTSWGDLVAIPISVGDQVMGVIAVATEHDASMASADSIAAAAGAAFTRLLRDASTR